MKSEWGPLPLLFAAVWMAGCTTPGTETETIAQPGDAAAAGAVGSGEQSDREIAEDAPEKAAPAAVKQGSITEVDANRVMQLQDDGKALLIDVRPRMFYGMGHLPGAISVPKKSFPLSLAKSRAEIDEAVAAGKVLVLYCQNVECPDGFAVGKEMAAMGYSVSLYKGGWEEWDMLGL